MEELIAASANKAKIKEIQSIFEGIYTVKSMADYGLTDDIEETGATFEENAVIKAQAVYDKLKKAVISDDSGLEAEALNGAPGIYSARYAQHGDDEANIIKLLNNLKNHTNRKARFTSVIALIDKNGKLITAKGEVQGEILHQKQGDNGFGYDPIFYSYDLKKSFGEATLQEKNKVSHRYRALINLLQALKNHPQA